MFWFACLTITFCTISIQNLISAEYNFKKAFFYKLFTNDIEALGLSEDVLEELKNEVKQISLSEFTKKLLPPFLELNSSSLSLLRTQEYTYDIIVKIDYVENRYEQLKRYRNASLNYDPSTFVEYAIEILDDTVGMLPRLQEIFQFFVGESSQSILHILEANVEKFTPECHRSQSLWSYYREFFLALFTNELKAYACFDFAFKIKKAHYKISALPRESLMFNKTKKRIELLSALYYQNLYNKSSVIWRCDPATPKEDETFIEMKNVFRRILSVESDLSVSFNDNGKTSCPLPNKEVKVRTVYNTLPQRECHNVVGCNTFEENESYNVCLANQSASGRRYKEVIHTRNSIFSSGPCSDNIVKTSKRSFFSTRKYHACNCVCEEDNNSDKYISLESATSDVQENYVIVGVQFVKYNHTLYIRARQGKLLPYGFINKASVTWCSSSAIECDGTASSDDRIVNKIRRNNKLKLEWYESRKVILDNFSLPKNEVITGVKFKRNAFGSTAVLSLAVQSTPFDLATGKLILERSNWSHKDPTALMRLPIELADKELPLLSSDVNRPHESSRKYFFFTPTGLTSKDAGQTMLPLIDAQPVYTEPPVPLTGIALDVKMSENSGGYLILKIDTKFDAFSIRSTIAN